MEKLVFDAESLRQRASGESRIHRALFKKLKKVRPAMLDKRIGELHDYHMAKADCLGCGNCCRSISPAINDHDIERIARYLKKRPSEITEKYLVIDEEDDYVFTSRPCPFLGEDNYCAVYEARPKACREFPHTDRSKQRQILDITFKNIAVCPVVFDIVQELKQDFS